MIEVIGMFEFNEKLQSYTRTIDDMVFECEEYRSKYDSLSEELASIYQLKLKELALFIKPEIDSFYGDDFSVETIIDHLGYPIIDLEINTITYVEHTFDEEHIITVEFDGKLESFLNTIIDG